MSIRCGGSPTCCARSSASPAPRSAATPAIAAPARCCSTATRSAPAWCRRRRSQGRAVRHGRGPDRRPAARRCSRPFHARRRAVRHLHAGHADGGRRSARAQSRCRPRRRCWMRSAACSAAAPAIARSSRRCCRCGQPVAVDEPAAGERRRRALAAGRRRRQAHRARSASAPTNGPTAALVLRAVRSPHHQRRFTIGDLRRAARTHPGLVRVLTARTTFPATTATASIPTGKDQPALAEGYVRYRGEAVPRWSATTRRIAAIRDAELPIRGSHAAARRHRGRAGARRAAAACQARPTTCWSAAGSRAAMSRRAGDIRGRGANRRGSSRPASSSTPISSPRPATRGASATASRSSPARRRPTWTATRSRSSWASQPEQVRIVPTACGGGFGGKLDLSLQPLIATRRLAARTGRCAASIRGPESMASTTKRHPARMTRDASPPTPRASSPASSFHGDFNTGAYASWGPTVANRVPVHATGPYAVPAVLLHHARDLHQRSAGRRLPRLRRAAGGDRARGADGHARRAARHRPARVPPSQRAQRRRRRPRPARCSRRAPASPRASRRCARTGARCARTPKRFNRAPPDPAPRRRHRLHVVRHRQHLAVQPVDHARSASTRDGTVHAAISGAVDIGQGSNTIMVQIAADALGVPVARSISSPATPT